MITIDTARRMSADNQISCQAAGKVWFADPSDLTGTGQGSCVPADIAARPDFDPGKLFSSFQWGIGSQSGVTTVAPPPPAALPPQAITGRVPDITAAWPQVISEVPEDDQCQVGFSAWVSDHPVAAVAALVGLFLVLGGAR